MRISKKSEYALRALLAIARLRHSVQIHELSRHEKIPVKFLEQILLALKNAGYLTSKRGVGGGYALRVEPACITVGEIIRSMDGPLAPVPCAASQPEETCTCPDPRTCVLRIFMTGVREELSAMLDHRTIEDMLRLAPDDSALAFEI
jgi:Rrf2 family protein